MFHWMMDCKAVTQIVCEAMDRPLPLHRRLWMRIHVMMCGRCAEFRRQIRLMRRAAAEEPPAREAEEQAPCLSDKARNRMEENIRDRCRE